MRVGFWPTVACILVSISLSSPLLAKDAPSSSQKPADELWSEFDDDWDQPCDQDDWGDDRVLHCEVREFSYPRSKEPIAINGGHNGGATVIAWDRDDVRILYRVRARALTKERARALAAEIQLELTKGWLRPEGPPEESRRETWSVEIKAWVPRASDLALRTHNGPLSVRGVRGTMDLNATNGPLTLVDLGGAVEARVENGPLHVSLAGSQWVGAGIDAEAVNGPVTLRLPANYSARLMTGTIHGPESIDYAIEPQRRRGWIVTTLGKGGPPVREVTTNGPFHIRQR